MSEITELAAVMPELPNRLLKVSSLKSYRRGQTILLRDTHLDRIFFVCKGMVMIFCSDESGRENSVVLIARGGVIGEMEALGKVERVVYSAKAFTDSELLSVPVSAFLEWVHTDFNACTRLAEVLAGKLLAASRQLTEYTSLDATERLVAILSTLGAGMVPHTRQELSDACSVSVRTINRCIKRLTEHG
ncbi:MAG: Crp/Fnr family transcriptional regulator, partial [Clostridia bacterium]